MTCSNCARHVTEAIQSVPEVASASIQLDAGRATVRWKGAPDVGAVMDAVKREGYGAEVIEDSGLKIEDGKEDPELKIQNSKFKTENRQWSPLSGWQFNVVVGLACTVPLIIGEWVFGWAMERWFQWMAFGLASIVQIFCGARFYVGTWRQLKVGSSNMDTLVALGSTTAFAYSVWALFTGAHGHLYFMESAAIITLISLGHWVESRTSAKAEGSLQALLHLAPQMARRRNADGNEAEVPVRELRVNDLVVLKPGDHVPTDGVVVEGEATVDESMLTGESIPVEKAPGSICYAGTVNLNGHLVMRVTATGEETALAHIIAAVARAQTSRAEIQRLGDRVSSVFVPIVVLIALATGLFWGFAPETARHIAELWSKYLWPVVVPESALAAGIIHAAAVLIIACPCAMGLATPVAIMAGTNAAARRGILVRDGVALERAGKITAIVFDKTGTLTQGKPMVVSEENFGRDGQMVEVRKLAAELARRSNHPISQAVAKLDSEDVALQEWTEMRGSGVQGRLRLNGQPATALVRLGSLRWLRESGVDLAQAKAFEEKWSAQGSTLLGIAADRNLLGMLAVEDTLKPGVAEVMQQLQRDGLETYLVTGDNPLTAQAIAKAAGIPSKNVFAEVRPELKAQFIQDLQKQGQRVAFVGDGINDAPALEAADLGIAVSRASDVAREAADIILLKSDIHAVPEALGLARRTLRTIKQNLFWAFFYNVAGIPLAAFGFMSPILCAAAMGLSDMVVIGNALRLLRGGGVHHESTRRNTNGK
ncbi:MAG: Cu+-exporting ATPase [Pedosphaera sp.]|nr:Cu+-exporting ATPase [Pedosphaera sp.]